MLRNPIRLLQLFTSACWGYPLVCVHIVGGGYDADSTRPFLTSLRSELLSDDFTTLREALALEGSDVGQLVRGLCQALQNSIPVCFSPGSAVMLRAPCALCEVRALQV